MTEHSIDQIMDACEDAEVSLELLTALCGTLSFALASARDGVLEPGTAEVLGGCVEAIELLLNGTETEVWGPEISPSSLGISEN